MGRLMELNADVGEGGPDALIMPHVQRVSIACGGHVGDTRSMRAALILARDHGVMAGAHPSYPDPANFGRRPIEANLDEISGWVTEQTRALQVLADELGMRLFHVKPHGALYNRAAVDEAVAQALIAALRELEGLALVTLAGSPLARWARQAGLNVLEEAFADRRYLGGGQLASRVLPGAVIEDAADASAQAKAIALGQAFQGLDGAELRVEADTLCLHGEGAQAAELARQLGEMLRELQ
jgi:UPF0271 protein